MLTIHTHISDCDHIPLTEDGEKLGWPKKTEAKINCQLWWCQKNPRTKSRPAFPMDGKKSPFTHLSVSGYHMESLDFHSYPPVNR